MQGAASWVLKKKSSIHDANKLPAIKIRSLFLFTLWCCGFQMYYNLPPIPVSGITIHIIILHTPFEVLQRWTYWEGDTR